MVRLAWTKNGAGSDVMVLHKTSAITTGPTDGTGYAVGNTIDGATVIYRGAATALEHVVTPGSTNVYKFYSVNSANYYSTGIGASATMGTYQANEWVNPFSYTNDTAFSASMKGGQGFGATTGRPTAARGGRDQQRRGHHRCAAVLRYDRLSAHGRQPGLGGKSRQRQQRHGGS